VDESNGVPQEEAQPKAGNGRKRSSRAVAPSARTDTDDTTPDTAPVLAQTIGNELREAREAAGLKLSEVAERTKIRPGILVDIEADAHDRLPALTYSLGFVKAYARTVGLDPVAAGERYRRESQKGDPVPTMVDLQPLEEQRLPSRKLLAGSVLAVLVALAGFWAWGAGWLTPAPPAPPQAPATPEPEPGPGSVEVTPEVPAANVAAPVTITAREEVWLRIADGDEAFFMGTMTPGQTMTLPPGRAWTLRTGRAGVLDVKVGDKAIPPLGGAAEQVRNISLKPEDLLGRPATGGLAPTTPAAGPVPGSAQPAAVPAPAGAQAATPQG
jgi:transcriptional regulator with XRE-family HTH domain